MVCHKGNQKTPFSQTSPKTQPLKNNKLAYRLLFREGLRDTVLGVLCPLLKKKELCRQDCMPNSGCMMPEDTENISPLKNEQLSWLPPKKLHGEYAPSVVSLPILDVGCPKSCCSRRIEWTSGLISLSLNFSNVPFPY